jgi:hypothetical protein
VADSNGCIPEWCCWIRGNNGCVDMHEAWQDGYGCCPGIGPPGPPPPGPGCTETCGYRPCDSGSWTICSGTVTCTSHACRTPPCFVAGTKVDTPQGPQEIQNLKAGDKIYTYNEKTGQVEIDEVVEATIRKQEAYGVVELSDGTKLEATPEHPFYLPKKKSWVGATKLKTGSVLLARSGKLVKVKKVSFSKTKKADVFNLHMKKNHNYYAGGILVHNFCGDLMIP